MSLESFVYLVDPLWFLYIATFIAFLINILTILQFRKRKVLNNEIPANLHYILASIAAGFVTIPASILLSLFKNNNENNLIVQVFLKYAQTITNFLELFIKRGSQENELISFIVMVIYVISIFAPWFLLAAVPALLFFKSVPFKKKLSLLFISFGLGILTTILIGLLLIGLFKLADPLQRSCEKKIALANEFRAHIENLCNQRSNTNECPRSETELRAFNPEKYDSIKSCSSSYYLHSESRGHIWLVKKNHITLVIYSQDKNAPNRKDNVLSIFELPNLQKHYEN